MILLFSPGENLRRRRQGLPALDAGLADRGLFGLAVRTGDEESGVTRLAVVPEEGPLATGGAVDLQIEAAGRAPTPPRPRRASALRTPERSGRIFLPAGRANGRVRGNQFVAIPAELAVPGHGHDPRLGPEIDAGRIG